MQPENHALRIQEVSKRFGASWALRSVSFAVEAGSIHALVGHNGSGKSTFVKLLSGYHDPDEPTSGSVFAASFKLGDPASARAAGIRFVHQDLGLVPTLSGLDNMLLGGERVARRRVGRAARRQEEARIRGLMSELGFSVDLRALTQDLSRSEQTQLAFTRALLAEDLRLLVLDEPTASLTAPDAELLFAAMRRIRDRGVGILFISHYMHEVLALADRVSVLRNGELVANEAAPDLTTDGLVSLMVGGAWAGSTAPAARAVGATVLEVRGTSSPHLDPIDLEVRTGEIVGIGGLEGSGREDVVRLVFGEGRRDGTVVVDGRQLRRDDPRGAWRAGVAYVPADRHRCGIVTELGIEENLTLADLRRNTKLGYLSRRAEGAEVAPWLDRLGIAVTSGRQPIGTLSGGNQQKVLMARCARTHPNLLLLDCPTQGVDVQAREEIYVLIEELASAGCAVLVSSSDDNELVRICDRVIVLQDGRVRAELARPDLNVESLARFQLAS